MSTTVYYVLLSMQNALGNVVTPQLRAITIDIDEKNYEFLPCIYYHGEPTEELLELYSILLAEIDTATKEHYFCREEILRLDYPKKIPVRGKLAFLRYEPNLPEFKREKRSFLLAEGYLHHAVYRLDMQEALLGKVTPALRHVSVDVKPDERKLISHFIYDGEISELDFHLATVAIEESRISFPEYEMDSLIERLDFPQEMSHRGRWLAYWRQEWKFFNGEVHVLSL